MSSPFQIESRPKWYALPQAVSYLIWFLAVVAGAFQLYRQLSTASLLQLPMSYKLGSIFTYLAFVVCYLFVLRCGGAFKRGNYGRLRVICVDNFTKILSILACISAAVVLTFTVLGYRSAASYGNEGGGVPLGVVIAIAVLMLWIFFLTVRVTFGKPTAVEQ